MNSVPPSADIRWLAAALLLATACSGDSTSPAEQGAASAGPPEAGPTPHPDRIVLTWTQDPSSSLSVAWRTDTTVTAAKAQIAPARAEPSFYTEARAVDATTVDLPSDRVEGEDVDAHYHSATFDDLGADSLYAYRVGDGARWSEWFHARTASAGSEPFSFIYFGDAQNNLHSHWSRAIRAAYSEAPDALFMIHAGDLVNNAHSNLEWGYWNEAGGWMQGMLPSLAVPGNHEYAGYGDDDVPEHLSIHWRPQFALPDNGPEGLEETVYHLDVQGMRVIGLNTDIAKADSAMLRRQTDWLQSTLRSTESRWVVVMMHHPLFASAEGRDNPDLREAWRPLFDRHRVDLVMQGHDHTYARGQSRNLTQGVNTRSPEGGTVYVNSVSGAKMYSLREERWREYEGIELQRGAENTQLFQVIRVAGDTLKYRSYTVTGELYDAFDLLKGTGDAPNEMVVRPEATTEERRHDNTLEYTRPGGM